MALLEESNGALIVILEIRMLKKVLLSLLFIPTLHAAAPAAAVSEEDQLEVSKHKY